ncbi:MAG: hypothetical protein ACOVSR_14330 [Bacteroidia bacterium]
MNTQTTEIKDKSKVQTNLERYIQNTGKTEAEYKAWATQVGRKMHINTIIRRIQFSDLAPNKHTERGRRLGRGFGHFFEEGTQLAPTNPS